MTSVTNDVKPVRPNPLQVWQRTHIDVPVSAIVAELKRGWYARCDECGGGGEDLDMRDGRCPVCDGSGRMYVDQTDEQWRARFERELKRAGFNPDAFDNEGRLVRD